MYRALEVTGEPAGTRGDESWYAHRPAGYASGPMALRSWVAASCLSVAACGGHKAPKEDSKPAVIRTDETFEVPDGSPLRDRLKIATAETEEVHKQLVAPAVVEAEPSRLAKISPPLTGRVTKLFVHFGDVVKSGAPLFTLDSPDLVSAQSDYLKAKSALDQAEKNLARQKDLSAHGIGAQKELEQAQTDRDTAHSELDRTTTRLRLLGIGPSGVGGPLEVRSPIAGRVIDLTVSPGQFVNDPAALIMTVADLSTVWVTASVQEKDIRRVHTGDNASVAFAAYPGENFTAPVLMTGDLLDPETRAIKVRISLPNADARLKPGMFATVTFKSSAVPEVVVPAQAVVLHGDKSSVFVETSPWKFDRKDVCVGDQRDGKIIVTQGLQAGTRIVTANAVLLQ